jgi:sugar phosphate isomerase/epimerase
MEGSARFGIATGAFVEERDDWDAALKRAAAEGWRAIELTAITEERFDALERLLEQNEDACGAFERVTIHAPVGFDRPVHEIVGRLAGVKPAFDVILHPDVYADEPAVLELGTRAVFENMDIQKTFGRDLRDLRVVFDRWRDAGFCLDVAHIWTNDRSLALAHDLLDAFGDRLRQLHVSGIEPDGTHRPTSRADLDAYSPLLERCRRVPWLLEAELVS